MELEPRIEVFFRVIATKRLRFSTGALESTCLCGGSAAAFGSRFNTGCFLMMLILKLLNASYLAIIFNCSKSFHWRHTCRLLIILPARLSLGSGGLTRPSCDIKQRQTWLRSSSIPHLDLSSAVSVYFSLAIINHASIY